MLKDIRFEGKELRAITMVGALFFNFLYFFYIGLATAENVIFIAVTAILGVLFVYMVGGVVHRAYGGQKE